jgi:protein-S-isoprenylcysteine O-methyltransferase Ste14
MNPLAFRPFSAAPIAGGNRRAILLDAAERVSVLALYACLVARMPGGLFGSHGLGDLLLLIGEGLVVVFFLIRRHTTDISLSPSEWLLAATATWAPLVVVPGGKDHAFLASFWLAVMLAGLLVQFHAKLTLARSFGMVPANRGLKTTGPYRVVRHPMYAGYFVMQLGFLALNLTCWNVAVYCICWTLQIRRLLAEERFLGRDPAYRDYQSQVVYRILPGLF